MEFGIGWGGDLGSLVLWQNDLTNAAWGRKGFWLTLPHRGSSLKEVRTGLEWGRLEGRVDSLSSLSRFSGTDAAVPGQCCPPLRVLESRPSPFCVYCCFHPSLRPPNLCDLKMGSPDRYGRLGISRRLLLIPRRITSGKSYTLDSLYSIISMMGNR